MSRSNTLGVLLAAFVQAASICTASAHDNIVGNVFFGFDFILTPLAIKWECGGDSAKDISQIEKLIEEFPSDAKDAGIAEMLSETTQALSMKGDLLPQLLGGLEDPQVLQQICRSALQLNIKSLDADALKSGEQIMTKQQEEAWRNFFELAGGL